MNTIDRRPGLTTAEFHENYFKPGIPVVIPGAMKEWSAHDKWNPDFFRIGLGDKKIIVDEVETTMREFMDSVLKSNEQHPSKYLNEVNIHTDFPELLPDISPYLSYASPDRLQTPFMPQSWGMRNGVIELLIGGKGTKFPNIHYDGFHMNTFITQVRGDKEFYFFSPDQTPYMYPTYEGSNKSQVNDVLHPDLNRFPLFANAKFVMTTIYQGDTIFLPAGWWHTTRILSLSIAVSTNNVGSNQWNSFAEDFSRSMSSSKLRQKIYRAYLKSAGSLMSLAGK